MPQTSVAPPVIGQEGTFASSADRGVTSRVAAEAIAVGKFVVLTAGDVTCELPDAATEITDDLVTLGFAALDPTQVTTDYAADEMVKIAEKGEIFVQVEDAVAAGGAVFIRYAAGGNGLGSARSDAGTTEAAQLPNAVFKTAAGVDGIAIVKFWR